ncbi:MAG TPA: PaaX family transcriptional regulator C-terminal domain-containing protein [Candidatus Limnocylindrales bacterium]|nr:PaaX family transcriptional regulator C-terminal domain-containing protein [Candidatus Limnocylindrales bacterium]
MAPKPKSIILDLLSTLRGRPAPVRLFVAAAELFGIEESSVRVALARLHAAGMVERDERGAYRLGAAAEPIQGQVRSWRHVEGRLTSWHGAWQAASFARAVRGREQRLQQRAIQFTGMRELAPGLWVRPDNLTGGLAATRENLIRLGLPVPVFRISDLDPAAQARACRLWPVEELRAGYRACIEELEASAARLPAMEVGAAMVESFLLGGQAIRRIVLDPLLPEAMVPAAERRALLATMTRYDLAGRACWARFMRGFGLPTAAAPMDQRLGERLAPAAVALAQNDPGVAS